MKRAICWGLLFLCVLGRGETPHPEDVADFGVFPNFEDRTGDFWDIRAGLNLLSLSDRAGATNRVMPVLGGSYSRFFVPRWGWFGGLGATRRAITGSTGQANAIFVDVETGIAWNRGSGFWSNVARETYRLGLVGALPLGSFSGPLNLGAPDARLAVGAVLEARTLFPQDDGFGVGYSAWVKVLLTSVLKSQTVRFAEAGFGLFVSFY